MEAADPPARDGLAQLGFGVAGAIDVMPPEQMRRLLDVNYLGTYYAARAALPVFRRQSVQ